MDIFNLTRDRDATYTIRGFVYQVDTTIERWLALGPGEALELERGEDIDIVRRALLDPSEESDRLLEQVKHREDSLTLRSSAARAFLANAFDHQAANPTLRLRFRYTTNASPGVERLTPIQSRTPGVTAWEELRRGAWLPTKSSEALGAIRQFLVSEAPEDIPAALWAQFQEFIRDSTDEQLLAFIQVCEWSTRNISAAAAAPALQQRLVELGHAVDDNNAEALYFRLFAHVFRRLAQPGLKRLTIADLRAEADAARSGAVPEDREILDTIRILLRTLEGRVSAVESVVVEVRAESATALARIDELARERGIRAAVEHVAATPVMAEPPLVDRLSSRRHTIDALLAGCAECSWIALHGASGSGKSQLALLIARDLSAARSWIRFRDLSLPEAVLRFDVVLAGLTGHPGGIESQLHEFARTMGSGAVVILDDLPLYREGDDFAVRLVSLVKAARMAGVRVLSTGVHPVPITVRDQFSSGILAAVPAPPFTDSEAGDVLRAYGAPAERLSDEFISMVNTLAGGHPALLRAAAQYLAARGWRLSTDALFGLLKKEFASDIAEEIISAVLRSVEDEDARELLYRLNVAPGEFGNEELRVLASVTPPVAKPRERLTRLLGLWVQREAGARYSVSPLVRSLGSGDLTVEVQRGCHSALAHLIVSQETIDPLGVNQALTHFAAAKAYDDFALLLLRALSSLHETPFVKPLPLHLALWTEYQLLPEVSLWLKPPILALQIAVRRRNGDDTTRWERELDSLIPQLLSEHPWSVLTAALLVSNALYAHNIRAAGRYLSIAMQVQPQAIATMEAASLAPPSLPLAGLVWLASGEVRTTTDIEAWFDMLEELPEEGREFAFADSMAQSSAVHVISTLLDHGITPPAEQRWPAVLTKLEELQVRAERMRLEPLVAACVSTRMSVHGEYLHEVDVAEALAVAYLSRVVGRDQEFWISNIMGLLFFDEKRMGEARHWLERAHSVRSDAFLREGVRAAIRLSNITGLDDPGRAVQIAGEGVAFADAHAEYVDYAAVEARGELAIARWVNSDLTGTFDAWHTAAETLIGLRDDSPRWKSLAVLFGHVSGYLAGIASNGVPPTLVDGQPYAAPRRGMFLLHPPGRETLYQDVFFHYAFVHLMMFADGIGDMSRAVYWARRGVESSRSTGYHQVAAVHLPVLRVDALSRGEYEQVLGYALEEGAIWLASRLQGAEPEGAGPDPALVLGPRSDLAWAEAEGHAVTHGLILVILHIGRRSLVDFEEARKMATHAIRACRSMAAASPAPENWHRTVDLVDRIFFGSDTPAQLSYFTSRIIPKNQDFANAFRTIGYLGESLRPRTPPVHCLSAHLAVAHYLDRLLRFVPSLRREVDAFFQEFWLKRLHEDSFRFSRPKNLKTQLDAAPVGGRDTLRHILNAVVRDLGVPPEPEQVREWLATTRDPETR